MEFSGPPASVGSDDERYDEARRRALAALDDATDRGGVRWKREELWESEDLQDGRGSQT